MTEEKLEELGLYKSGNFVKQIHGDYLKMDLGWHGLRVNLKEITPAELVREIYEAGKAEGYENGRKSVINSFKQLFDLERSEE